MKDESTWQEWSQYVLRELERQNEEAQKLTKEVRGLREDMVLVRFKLGTVGAVAGIAAGTIAGVVAGAISSILL